VVLVSALVDKLSVCGVLALLVSMLPVGLALLFLCCLCLETELAYGLPEAATIGPLVLPPALLAPGDLSCYSD